MWQWFEKGESFLTREEAAAEKYGQGRAFRDITASGGPVFQIPEVSRARQRSAT